MSQLAVTTGALDQIVRQARSLYSLPAVAMELLDLTSDPDVDAEAIRRCMQRDPALVGKVLRTVNSSVFGLSRPVGDLGQAVGLLGIKPLKILVLGFSLPPEMFSAVEAETLSRYWRHTLTKAAAARQLSGLYDGVSDDDAFLAGLLQDIGELVLLQQLGPSYAQFLTRVWEEQADLLELELSTLGFDHRIVSARLLAHWGMPTWLSKVVGAAADGPAAEKLPPEARPLPDILALAELFAQLLAAGRLDSLARLREAAQQASPGLVDQLESTITTLQTRVADLADVLNVQLIGELDFDGVLAAAHARLGEAVEAAGEEIWRPAEATPWAESEAVSSAARNCAGADVVDNAAATSCVDPPAATAAAKQHGLQLEVPPPAYDIAAVLASAVAWCRRARAPLSLLLIELDSYSDLVFTLGNQRAVQLMARMQQEAYVVGEAAHVAATTDARFALVLQDNDRPAALETARLLLDTMPALLHDLPNLAQTSLSIGAATVAMPARNFPPDDLLQAAERCLYAASAGGGNLVKSIDIY